MKGKTCEWEGCENSATSRSIYCSLHQKEYRTKYKLAWNKRKRILTQEPKSARHNKVTWNWWEALLDLSSYELQALITKRKEELKHERNPDKIEQLKTEITIINEIYEKVHEKEKEKWRNEFKKAKGSYNSKGKLTITEEYNEDKDTIITRDKDGNIIDRR